jgi:hypothetical protein
METILFGGFLILATIAVAFFITKLIGIVFPMYVVDFAKYFLFIHIAATFYYYDKIVWGIIFLMLGLIVFLLSKKK